MNEVTFNIEEHADSVVQARKGREKAGHIWLYGFHYLVKDKILSYYKIDEYVSNKLKEHPLFTKFKSFVQMNKLMEACLRDSFSEGPIKMSEMPSFVSGDEKDISNFLNRIKNGILELDVFYIHLPVNSDYHLEFPLSKRGEFCEFIYSSCKRREGLESHGFPEIFLRESVDFDKDVPNMYDNRVSVNHQSKEIIMSSYKTIEEFVDNTSITQ